MNWGETVFKFYKGKVGSKAYTVSKVWKLGWHIFLNGEDLIFRVCYLRNRNIHYRQTHMSSYL